MKKKSFWQIISLECNRESQILFGFLIKVYSIIYVFL
jgi:hypothetical protein